jgi:hypothetical protein
MTDEESRKHLAEQKANEKGNFDRGVEMIVTMGCFFRQSNMITISSSEHMPKTLVVTAMYG